MGARLSSAAVVFVGSLFVPNAGGDAPRSQGGETRVYFAHRQECLCYFFGRFASVISLASVAKNNADGGGCRDEYGESWLGKAAGRPAGLEAGRLIFGWTDG